MKPSTFIFTLISLVCFNQLNATELVLSDTVHPHPNCATIIHAATRVIHSVSPGGPGRAFLTTGDDLLALVDLWLDREDANDFRRGAGAIAAQDWSPTWVTSALSVLTQIAPPSDATRGLFYLIGSPESEMPSGFDGRMARVKGVNFTFALTSLRAENPNGALFSAHFVRSAAQDLASGTIFVSWCRKATKLRQQVQRRDAFFERYGVELGMAEPLTPDELRTKSPALYPILPALYSYIVFDTIVKRTLPQTAADYSAQFRDRLWAGWQKNPHVQIGIHEFGITRDNFSEKAKEIMGSLRNAWVLAEI